MALNRKTLEDGSKFWDYIDWTDLSNTVLGISVASVTSGTLFDLLTEIVDSNGSGQFIVRGDANGDRQKYDIGRYMDNNDALRVLQFGSDAYGSLTDAQYDHILNYILYSEDLQKYYGAPSSWTAADAASAIFYDADTGDTVPEIVIPDKAQTLTNKTINSSNNIMTINLGDSDLSFSGTIGQFNSALTDSNGAGSFVTSSSSLILKHGIITATLDEDVVQAAVTFDEPFPNNLYGIQTTIKADSDINMDAFEAYIRQDSVGGFTWRVASSNSSGRAGEVYWLAYGN